MAGDGLKADDLQTIELDDALRGAAPSGLPLRLSASANWRLALGLMGLAGALAWFASISPWALASVAPFYAAVNHFTVALPDPTLTIFVRLLQSRGTRSPGMAILLTGVQIYAALGVFISGALFTRLWPRLRSALLFVYIIWLATLVGRLLFFSVLLASGDHTALPIDLPEGARLVGVVSAAGYWLAWLAALLGVVGVVATRRMLQRDAADSHDAPDQSRRALPPRPRSELWAAGVATVGALIWTCGFFTLPWVTQGCAGLHVSLTHFASDTCAGLGAADTLTRSPIAQLFAASSSDPLTSLPMGASIPMSDTLFSFTARALASVGFIYLLLAALACWALLRQWSGPVGARRYGWSLAWLALACLVAAFAYEGSGVALANPVTLNLNITGAWTYGPGLAVTLIGLAMAALGLSCALASALRLGQWQR